jgi:hypothetical protein
MPPVDKRDRTTEAEAFIKELFLYVLDRRSVSREELDHWTHLLLDTADPISIFRKFAESKENKVRQELLSHAHTLYPNGHFYSPVVDTSQVVQDGARIFRGRVPEGLDLNIGEQERQFRKICIHFSTLPFSEEADGKHRYYYNNTSYSFGDACVYWGFIASFRPKRIIEIGSGFTSAMALDAIDYLGLDTECTFIDPFPELLHKVAAPIDHRHKVIAEPIQKIDPSLVSQLGEGDLLFIDSSHVVKTGSDVHFEITELLSRVNPGVTIHFHDMFYPFEYPRKWVVEDNKSWNELYFVHAFLMYNSAFEILYFNHCFAMLLPDLICQQPQHIASRILLNPGGGLWLRRKG